MCGIITAINHSKNKETVNDWVINQLEDQINRGQQGFGITFVDDKGNYKIMRATEIAKTLINLYSNPSKFIMLHHRQPTSSINKLSQTHPIMVDNKKLKHKYLVVHNGIIINEDELKETHRKLGFSYTTQMAKNETYQTYGMYDYSTNDFNDSEAVAIELALYIEKKIPKIRVDGNIAAVILQIDKKKNKVVKLFYCRDANPLKLSQTRGKIRLSSEGEGAEIKPNMLYGIDLKSYKVNKRKLYNMIAEQKAKQKEKEYDAAYNWENKENIHRQPMLENAHSSAYSHIDNNESVILNRENINEYYAENVNTIIEEFFMRLGNTNAILTMNKKDDIKDALDRIGLELEQAYEAILSDIEEEMDED